MNWEFNNDRPIYTQIVEQIKLFIVSGEIAAGSKLASVRELAADAEVNPNTMQKALSELERDGLVYSQRTAGRFITEDLSMIEQVKTQIASQQVKEFLQKMEHLGYSKQTIIQLIEKIQVKEEE